MISVRCAVGLCFMIALTANQGTAMLRESATTMGEEKLNHAPQESLEYQSEKLNFDSIYLSMSKLNGSDVFKLRYVGNCPPKKQKQFEYIVSKSRMDGVLFIKKTVKLEKRKEALSRKFDVGVQAIYSYKDALDKIRNKQVQM